jgi:hypothetical protein
MDAAGAKVALNFDEETFPKGQMSRIDSFLDRGGS